MLAADLDFARAISRLIDCNPFLPERTIAESEALGDELAQEHADWNLHPEAAAASSTGRRMDQKALEVFERMRNSLSKASAKQSAAHGELYRDLGYFVLYGEFRDSFRRLMQGGEPVQPIYQRFRAVFAEYFPAPKLAVAGEPAHLFALLYQLYRAFHNLFDHLIGSSPPMIQLRAAIWQSIFTCDLQRYRTVLYNRMSEFTTLACGHSGSGKELVARAIGRSCYIPFDETTATFTANPSDMFVSLNLSAMNPSLIESELFGHMKGAFTGADQARAGWLQSCPQYGTVFLDEIGELDELIQVKLLRVLQEREFQPVGDTRVLPFHGRIIAATNRDMAAAVASGKLRADFVYRICSDVISMPSLASRLRSEGGQRELQELVRHLATRILGAPDETITGEILLYIEQQLGRDYPWLGNVRELEQCVRSYLVRKSYQPLSAEPQTNRLSQVLETCELTADELTTLYCQVVYGKTNSYLGAAKHLGLDRRTVKARQTQ